MVIILLYWQKAFCQYNLVPNHNFEDNIICPTSINMAPLPSPWYLGQNLDNKLAFFHNCATFNGYSIPANNAGFQYARTGNGYAGIETFYNFFFDGRYYLQTALNQSLLPTKYYYGEFWVSLGNQSRYATNNIGMLLTDTAIKVNSVDYPLGIGLIPANPQVYNYSNPIIKDTLNWVKISGVFVAQGGENFITIGNFRDDDNTQVQQIHSLPGSSRKAGYFIDDVKLIPLDSMQLKADAGRDTTINLGDSAFIGSYINGISNINWYNSANTIIGTGKPFLYVKPTVNTFYVIEQTIAGQYSRDTVNVYVNTVVPLTINNYQLIINNEGVVNNWITSNEINVSHFNIQYSNNGRDFTTVKTVTANNNSYNQYSVFTYQPTVEKGYYRIEAVDKDGKLSYSKILPFTLNRLASTLSIYPNPASTTITVKSSFLKQIVITNILGRVVYSKQINNGNNTILIPINTLPKGFYSLQAISTTGKQENKTFVVE
jgi:hypothetical protein